MDHSQHNKIVSFIWSIADDCLRDVFVRGKYRDVILPMFVLRRLDCLLEPSKDAVLEEVRFQREVARLADLDPAGLKEASGHVFYNTSRFTLKSLLGNLPWEMLHWFLKFLIPKLKIKDPDADKLNELLNSVDLSTYGLQRSRLNVQVGLDAAPSEVQPQNPNVRGLRAEEGKKDPLDEIIRQLRSPRPRLARRRGGQPHPVRPPRGGFHGQHAPGADQL